MAGEAMLAGFCGAVYGGALEHRPHMNRATPGQQDGTSSNGLPFALGACLAWGVFPIYFKLLGQLPPLEFVGWRILFTLPVCLLIVATRRQGAQLRLAAGNPRVLGLLTASALMIGTNWLVFIAAVQSGHMLAGSLGYYINPLVNVLAGTLFLGEKLNRRQWIAVALAAAGVSLLAWGAREMLGISLTLAVTFAVYGLLRKLAPVASVPGLSIETALLVPVAIGILIWQAHAASGLSIVTDPSLMGLTALSGIITAVPLLLFAVAAQRMDYSMLGFVQYLAPTMQFLIGLFVFGEPLKPVQLACFMLIWSAIAVFCWDMLARRSSHTKVPGC